MLLARCWSLHCRLFLPVASGVQGWGVQGSRVVTCAESHGPDPGLAGRQEMQAVGDTLNTGVVPEVEQLRIRV